MKTERRERREKQRDREVINKDMDRFSYQTKSHAGRKDEWRNTTSTEERQMAGAGINTSASNKESDRKRENGNEVCATMYTMI